MPEFTAAIIADLADPEANEFHVLDGLARLDALRRARGSLSVFMHDAEDCGMEEEDVYDFWELNADVVFTHIDDEIAALAGALAEYDERANA